MGKKHIKKGLWYQKYFKNSKIHRDSIKLEKGVMILGYRYY